MGGNAARMPARRRIAGLPGGCLEPAPDSAAVLNVFQPLLKPETRYARRMARIARFERPIAGPATA